MCTSVNEVMCHGIPDSRQLLGGDILNIDVTVYLNVSPKSVSNNIGHVVAFLMALTP